MTFKEKALVIVVLVASAKWARALPMESGCEGRCNNSNPVGSVQAAFIEQQENHFDAILNDGTAIGAKIDQKLTKFGSPEGGIITGAYRKQGVNYFGSASSRKGENNAGLIPIKQTDGSNCDPTQNGIYNCTRRSEQEDHGIEGTENGQADQNQHHRGNFSATVIPDASHNRYPSKQGRSEHSGEIGHVSVKSVNGRIDDSHDYRIPPLNPITSDPPIYNAPNQNRPEPFGNRRNRIGEFGNGNTNYLPGDFRNPPLNSLSGGPTNGYNQQTTNNLPRGYGSWNTFTPLSDYPPNKSSSEHTRAHGIGESGNDQASYTPHAYVNKFSGGPSTGYYPNQSGSENSRERNHGNGETGNGQINYPVPPARQPNEPNQNAYPGDSNPATGQQYPNWYPGNVASNTAPNSSPGSIHGSGSQQQYYSKYGATHNTPHTSPSRPAYDDNGGAGQQYANIPNTGSFNIASSTIPETYGNGQALLYVRNGFPNGNGAGFNTVIDGILTNAGNLPMYGNQIPNFQSEVIYELPAQEEVVIVANGPIASGMMISEMPFFYPY